MGSSGIAVPGVGLGGTAGTLPGPTGVDPQQQQQQTDPLKQILQMIMSKGQQQQQPQMVPTGVQAPPSQRQHQLPGFMGITAGVQAIYNHEKQKKLAEAKSDWNDLQVSMQKYIQPDGKVDQQAYSDPAVMQVLGNPKKLKEMAKALNQDWMNPEKTTVYGEALKASLAEQKQKQQAASGLKQMMSHLIHKAQNPQMNQDQQQQMAQQVMSKAPISKPQPIDSKEQQALLTELLKEQDADKRQADKEEYDQFRQEQTQKFETWKTQTTAAHQETMERLRETSAEKRESDRELSTLKALGMRLSDADRRKLEITPSQMNTEVNSTLTSMRQQLAQETGQLKTLKTQAQTSKKWYNVWQGGVGKGQMDDAQSQVNNLKASIDYIEKNRAAVISGKAQLDDVIDQAQSIASGTIPGEAPVK
jgi:hypothetical protein